MAGTGRRNRHKKGDHLMVDDFSGFVEYASNMVLNWDGFWVLKQFVEPRNPQEFITAGTDPQGLMDVRPPAPQEVYTSAISSTIGTTSVSTPRGPASHLFE